MFALHPSSFELVIDSHNDILPSQTEPKSPHQTHPPSLEIHSSDLQESRETHHLITSFLSRITFWISQSIHQNLTNSSSNSSQINSRNQNYEPIPSNSENEQDWIWILPLVCGLTIVTVWIIIAVVSLKWKRRKEKEREVREQNGITGRRKQKTVTNRLDLIEQNFQEPNSYAQMEKEREWKTIESEFDSFLGDGGDFGGDSGQEEQDRTQSQLPKDTTLACEEEELIRPHAVRQKPET